MKAIEIKKAINRDGKLRWTMKLNDKEGIIRDYLLSRSLTGSTSETRKGIFTEGDIDFYWGSHKKTFKMLPLFKDDQTAQECLINLIENIKTVRSWVDSLRQKHTGEQIARYELEDF